MKTLTIDRYEGQYTICEDNDRNYFAINTSELPEGTAPGTVIIIDDAGAITVDLDETVSRKQRIAAKMSKIIKE